MASLLIIGIVTAVLLYLWGQRKPAKFPPGPWGLPIFGAFPLLGLRPYVTLMGMKEKYGPIVGFDFMGSKRAVAITDYKLVKEVANDPAYSGRPNFHFMQVRCGGTAEGIIHTEGSKWQEQKRFTLRKLRDFGFGTRSMEAIVHDEITELIESLKEQAAQGLVSTQNLFGGAIINALWTIVAGERFDQKDPKVKEIYRIFGQDLSSLGMRTILSMFVPAIPKYLPDWISGESKLIGPIDKMKALIEPYIEAHMKTHIRDQPRDFIDAYIDEIKATKDSNSSFHASHPKSLLYTIFDLFMAGGETTASTLNWIFLFMSRHPHVQEKLHAEIDRVVGNSRLPTLADRQDMPYMEAVTHEVLRFRPLVPATLQRTLQDTELQGYRIPQDTTIILNLYDMHYDPVLWGDPDNFRPERFLNKEETKFVHREGFAVFSLGKRACLGERLARDELFLFGTSLFQVFEVDWDRSPGKAPPTLEATKIGVALPIPQKLVLRVRA